MRELQYVMDIININNKRGSHNVHIENHELSLFFPYQKLNGDLTSFLFLSGESQIVSLISFKICI